MKETLTCTVCEKNWKRDITRGRKPTVCPRCVKAQLKEESRLRNAQAKARDKATSAQLVERSTKQSKKTSPPPAPPSHEPAVEVQSKPKITAAMVLRDYYPKASEDLISSTAKGSEWHCSYCKKTLKMNVALSAVPTHHCPPNTTRVKAFERVS